MTSNNTSYKVHAHQTTDAKRLTFNIEEGAMVITESGIWQVYNGAWRRIYPQSGTGSGLGLGKIPRFSIHGRFAIIFK
jgi:hypothetical protein